MGLSERTIKKLRAEAEEVGGKVYDDDQDPLEEDVTHLDEDDDPLSLIGTVYANDEPVEWDIDANLPVGEVPDTKEEKA